MSFKEKRRAGWWLLSIFLILAAFFQPAFLQVDSAAENPGGLKVHYLDVGQGTAL